MIHDTYTVQDGGYIFTIDSANLPQRLNDEADTQEMWKGMQEDLLKAVGATKTGEDQFQVDGFSGREIRFDLQGG